jgi:hypothetical protein
MIWSSLGLGGDMMRAISWGEHMRLRYPWMSTLPDQQSMILLQGMPSARALQYEKGTWCPS